MALIKCEECGKEISDKAEKCPNCGNPINIKVKRPEVIRENKEGCFLQTLNTGCLVIAFVIAFIIGAFILFGILGMIFN